MKLDLTDDKLRKLRLAPGVAQVEWWDTVMPDLYLRASSGGARTWMLRKKSKGKVSRVSIGTWPALRVYYARQMAQEMVIGTVATPAAGPPFQTIAEQFIREYLPTKSTKTQKEWKRILNKHAIPAFGAVRPNEAQDFRASVRACLDAIEAEGKTHLRNRVFECVRRVHSWASGKDLVSLLPVFTGFEKLTEEPREVSLSDDDLRRVLAAGGLDYAEWRAFWWMLFLTGARRGSVLAARWDQLDLEAGTWRIPTKNLKGRKGAKRSIMVPLVPTVIKALETQRDLFTGQHEFVFANRRTGKLRDNPQKAADRVRELSGVDGLRIHDFRHIIATGLGRLKVVPHVIDAVLHHEVGNRMSRVYNEYAYFEEKREALLEWEAFLLSLRPAAA